VTHSGGKRKQILLADDAAWIRDLNALLLSRLGRVETAADGREAYELARIERPDLIVTDLNMPIMNGVELCDAIRSNPLTEEIPILVLTSSSAAQDREDAIHAGASDVLSKPVERPELLAAAQRLLTGTAPRSLPRIQIDAPAWLRTSAQAWTGRIRNLSRGGVYVESERSAEPETELEVALKLPEIEGPVKSTAEVRWVRRDGARQVGMGMRFLGLDRKSAKALSHYVGERVAFAADR